MQLGDDLGAAEHGPAHALVREGRFLEMVEDDVVRRVLGLADLLQDDAALALQLRGVIGRMLQDVGDDIDGERQVVRSAPWRNRRSARGRYRH